MKKLIYNIALFLILGLTMFNCEKERVIEKVQQNKGQDEKVRATVPEKIEFVDKNDYSKLAIKGNVLEFSSIDYYSSFLIDSKNSRKADFLIEHLKELSFNSFLNNTKSNETDIDYFISSILNPEGIVKIGKWYLKLNFQTEKVYACSDELSNAYDLVLGESKEENGVYEFTFDDEVLPLLEDEANLNNKALFKRCPDRKAKKRSNQTPVHNIISNFGTYVDAELRSDYKKFGIYFTLISEGALQSNDLNLQNNVTMWFYLANCSYDLRCGSGISNYTYPTRYPTNLQIINSVIMKGTFRWYGGMKQLKNYNYLIRMRVDHTYFATPPNNFTDTYSQWTHISD